MNMKLIIIINIIKLSKMKKIEIKNIIKRGLIKKMKKVMNILKRI